MFPINFIKVKNLSEKTLYGFFTLALSCFLIFLPTAIVAKTNKMAQCEKPESVLKIGVFYSISPTGKRYRDGVFEAIDQVESNDKGCLKIKYQDLGYTPNSPNIERLVKAIDEGALDLNVIIGPTESSVFLRMLEQHEAFKDHEVTVISPLVAANIPLQSSGWFFRTNVNVQRRSQTIYDYLNKYWINSIGLLYANTEFGRRAEEAFRNELNDRQRQHYIPLLYNSPPLDARGQFRQILNNRPEAVGIIGEREDLVEISRALKNMNDWDTPYRPILFTIIDARYQKSSLEDFYFVSVAPAPESNKQLESNSKGINYGYDDVAALAFDTTRLVMRLWQKVLNEKDCIKWIKQKEGNKKCERLQIRFRDRLEAALRGEGREERSITGMHFSGFENMTAPQVFHIGRDTEGIPEVTLEKIDTHVTLLDKFKFKFSLIQRRFGYLPFLNIVILFSVVILTTILDIKKWYPRNLLGLFKPIPNNFPFFLLLFLNLVLVLVIYIYMAETGTIKYDSITAALAFAIAPLALMRATLFETKTGKTLGLGKWYDSILQWVNHHLMLIKHNDYSKQIHLLAYNNSIDGMKSYLKEIYRNSRTVAQRVRLETELDEKANDKLSYLEQRKECAELLYRTVNWKSLTEDSMAPPGDLKDIDDPENVIRKASLYFARHPEEEDRLDKAIEVHLKQLKQRESVMRNALEKDLEGLVGHRSILRRKISFLFVLHGYELGYLEELGYKHEPHTSKTEEK